MDVKRSLKGQCARNMEFNAFVVFFQMTLRSVINTNNNNKLK